VRGVHLAAAVFALRAMCGVNLPKTKPPPAEASHVMLTFVEGEEPVDGGRSGGTVRTMIVGGDTVLPPTCDPVPKGPRAELCSPAFRRVLRTGLPDLVDVHTGTHGSTYVFAMTDRLCGASAYWVIQVSSADVLRISQPIERCLFMPPMKITWGPPFHIILAPHDGPGKDYVLDDETFTLIAK